jgi:hypothetical protein
MLGKYQLSEDALRDIGFFVKTGGTGANDYAGNWTALAQQYGVTSSGTFLDNVPTQEYAACAYAR